MRRLEPAGGPLRGRLAVPGDKSISHRVALLGALADAPCRARGWLDAQDTRRSLDAVAALGARAQVRDGTRAVPLAERACELTGSTNLWLLSTLAAAYAEAGRFPEAVDTQQKVCELAAAQEPGAASERFQRRLELYRSGQAYHEP